ncbi:hypothetical protein ABID95_001086 [Streptomyces atratus]
MRRRPHTEMGFSTRPLQMRAVLRLGRATDLWAAA